MKKRFYSSGKLLITGEYLVVDGAKGLAIPCKYGQDMSVEEMSKDKDVLEISWTSKLKDGVIWFEGMFFRSDGKMTTKSCSDQGVADYLCELLNTGMSLSDNPIHGKYTIETQLEFPRDWGLGSSSTMIANLAEWFNISPFSLFFETTKGSGYDLACAKAEGPILYQKNNEDPIVNPISWNPSYADQLCFVFLGEKQKSDREVKKYAELNFDRKKAIEKVNQLTLALIEAEDLVQFESIVASHEHLMSEVLGRPTIKEERFPDYEGSVKSLGAWGGDFVLVSLRSNTSEYFKENGYLTLIPFHDMIKPPNQV